MHPKYWKRPRLMGAFSEDGAAGGSMDALAESFASHFDEPGDEPPAAAPAEESQDDAAARLAAEDVAKPAAETEQADSVEDAEPQKFTVKVDGKDVTLTADEMADHVKNGMRQADYSRKTAETAELRKTADNEIAQARQQRDQYGAKLEGLLGQANYEVNALRAQLTDELLQTDPHGYMVIQRTAETRQAAIQQAERELQQINQQRQTEAADAQRQNLAHQQEQLLAKVPEWKDPAKATAEVALLKQYLAEQGYQAAETDFTDHRSVVLARKAMQYDALMARAKATQPKVAAAPAKVARPTVPVEPTQGRSTAMRRFEQTGSRDDAAAVFAEYF